ncbi:MAG: SurA N-terminal domain-containing protein [Deltaproteobacteria bacterium]|nr:SurA N-terminal domain-containing protein [Deltaproteobacteria bacterium]
MFFELLRSKQKSVMSFLLIGFATVLIASFGLDTYNYGANQSPVAIHIDDHEITFQQYYQHHEELTRMYRNQFGENFETFKQMINLEQQTTDSLINDYLVDRIVSQLGLGVSQRQIESRIQTHPFFAGGFTFAKWQEFQQLSGMSEAAIEQASRQELVRQQLLNTFAGLAFLSPQELEASYSREKQKHKFRFLQVRQNEFESKVDRSDAKVAEYYDRNKEKYERPAEVSFSYVRFSPDQFAPNVEVNEEDLVATYNDHREEFIERKTLKLESLSFLLEKKDDAEKKADAALAAVLDKKAETAESQQSVIDPNDALKEKAKAAVERLRGGESFEKVAADFVKDPAARAERKEFGTLEIEALPETIRSQADALNAGETSEVVDAGDKLSILYAPEVKEARQKTLEEIRTDIERIFRSEQAPIYLSASADDAFRRFQGDSGDLKTFAEKSGLQYTESPSFVNLTTVDPTVPMQVVERALKLQPGDREQINVDNESFILQITEVKAPSIPELAAAKEKVLADYVAEETQRLAREHADAILKAAKESENPVDSTLIAGRTFGIASQETSYVTHAEAKAPFLTTPEEIDAAFALTLDAPLAPKVTKAGDSYYVVQLSGIEPADMAQFKAERAKIAAEEAELAGSRILQAVVETSRARAEIRVDPQVSARPGNAV